MRGTNYFGKLNQISNKTSQGEFNKYLTKYHDTYDKFIPKLKPEQNLTVKSWKIESKRSIKSAN